MKTKREIFLFGAGATLNWKAPSTSELTKLVRESGFTLINSDTTITEFIFQKLIDKGYTENEVNFETIINVIEELIIYYSEFNKEHRTPSLLAAFLSAKYDVEMLNYSIRNNKREHGYKLQIPVGVDYPFAKPAYYRENPNQLFLQHLLSELLTVIIARISKYAYHTPSHSVIEKESDDSLLFREWMVSIEQESALRLYTLNYDRLFKLLLQEEKINCFEGFDGCESIGPGDVLRPNIPRILTDIDSNIHYNLHGSAFWRVLTSDRKLLPNPEIVFIGYPELQINDNQTTIEVEKGKPILMSNIITGFQKAQRAMVTPYKQMQSAFDKDCCLADKITIIGYSFGDEHINQSIKTALRYNQKLTIEIIDPGFIDRGMDHDFAVKFFPYYDSDSLNPIKVNDNLYSYYDDKFQVYTMRFGEYLKMKQKLNYL